MTTIKLTLELQHNSRTVAGLQALDPKHFVDDFEYSIQPWYSYREKLVVTLDELDLGAFDANGDAYIADLLQIVEGDIIGWYDAAEG